MAMHVKFLELRQNQFPFGINDSCKLDSSTRVQCNQAYFMKEVYFFQLSFMRYLVIIILTIGENIVTNIQKIQNTA